MSLICKSLTIIVIIIGLTVLAGWKTDNQFLKAWSPHSVSMHYSTAISFILTSLCLFILSRKTVTKGYQYVGASFFSSLVIFIMGGQFLSAYFSEFVKFYFVHNDANIETGVVKGIPSMGTIGLFCLLNLRCLMILGEIKLDKLAHNLFLWITLSAIISSTFGHLFNIPSMYFYYPSFSSGMAINTTFCFFLLWLVFKCNKNLNERMFLE